MIIDKVKKVYGEEISQVNQKASNMMIGKWVKCDKCKDIIYKDALHMNLSVCPNCAKHFRLSSRRRIAQIADKDTFQEIGENITTKNPLEFEGYMKKIETLKEKTKLDEAVKCGICKIEGQRAVLCVMDGNFMMGSMGGSVGERITISIETAIKNKLPLVIFCVSGGARMQEGIVSLMQMAKTSAALSKLNKEGLLYISVLTDPTTGGVTASFASLGDIILAEPGALIGFAGPRVIEQTIGQKLPEGFQSSEFLLEHGFIDKIVERKDMKKTIAKLLSLHSKTKAK